MCDPSRCIDFGMRVEEEKIIVGDAPARLEVRAYIEAHVVQLDSRMRNILKHRARRVQVALLMEPLVDDDELMGELGGMTTIAVGKALECRDAVRMTSEVDGAYRRS